METICSTGKRCLTKKECIAALKRKKRNNKQRVERRYYHCKKCNMFHLTHLEDPPEDPVVIHKKYQKAFKKYME